MTPRARPGGHPVLRCKVSNAAVAMDPAGASPPWPWPPGLAEQAQAPVRSVYDSDERAAGFLFG